MNPIIRTAPTGRQLEVLRAIESMTEAHGYPPTVRELGRRVGLASPSAVAQKIESLERRGLVRREHARARSIVLTEAGRQRIAVLAVLAGAP